MPLEVEINPVDEWPVEKQDFPKGATRSMAYPKQEEKEIALELKRRKVLLMERQVLMKDLDLKNHGKREYESHQIHSPTSEGTTTGFIFVHTFFVRHFPPTV